MRNTQTTCCGWHIFIWRINKRPKTSDQDVFVKLYTRGEAIAPGCEKAWLLRVTVNCCRDLWRSAWLKRVVLGAPTLEIIPAQEDTIEQREEKAELMRRFISCPSSSVKRSSCIIIRASA